MDHHHQENPQPPQFTAAADAPPPSFTGFVPPQPAAPPSHPPYAEMITAAITSENAQGKGGSSKRAIAKYIDRVYTNLPPSHSELLTHYIKELKHNGYLVMVKNSYQLASVLAASDSAAGVVVNPALSHTGSAPQVPALDLNTSQHFQQQLAGFVDPSPKRRPGRPLRARSEAEQAQIQVNGAGAGVGGTQSSAGKKRGRPPKQQVIRPHNSQAEHQIMMEPVDMPSVQPMLQPEPIAMDGLGVEGEKRRPGRPPKLTPVVPLRKPAQVNGSAQVVDGPEQVAVKRRPGRPARKNVEGGQEGGVVMASSGAGGKPRGRPKRSGLVPVSRPVGKRPRGRPPRAGGGAVVGGKRRGRPPKAAGGPPKVRRLSASVERPRKNAASLNQESEWMSNEELTKKLDLIQSKIRDAVDVLRPYIPPHENTPLMAIQQLEELVAPIITAPQTAPPVMATPMTEIVPMPVNMNAPPPPLLLTMGAPPPEPVSAPFMTVPGQFSVTEPFQVPSSFDNQQRMSWMTSNEAQS